MLIPFHENDRTDSIIIHTKLDRPLLPDGMVYRTQLLRRLDKKRHRTLTLVFAPAGYGKSVLISSWLEASARPGAWVSLDENDNNLQTFMTYLLTAINRLFPEARKNTWRLLSAVPLLCGAVSRPLETALISTGVRVIGFTCGGLEDVLSAYIKGCLTDKCFQVPGYGEKRTKMMMPG